MTLQECYDAMGADYNEVMSRLRTEERTKKFLLKLPKDPSYEELCAALDKREIETAFRAAHTLKGVGQNLSLTPLYRSAAELCEALRGKQAYEERFGPMLAAVQRDYKLVTDCIAQLAAEA
jgi:HPt (histidine-containing phosphotransfer) domain-containing protein